MIQLFLAAAQTDTQYLAIIDQRMAAIHIGAAAKPLRRIHNGARFFIDRLVVKRTARAIFAVETEPARDFIILTHLERQMLQ